MQEDGLTGPVPSWRNEQRYPACAECYLLQPLPIDIVLAALGKIADDKGRYLKPDQDGVIKRLTCYVIPEKTSKPAKVVAINRRQAS
jgi:hypothetical protein